MTAPDLAVQQPHGSDPARCPPPLPPDIALDLAAFPCAFLEAYPYPAFILAYIPPPLPPSRPKDRPPPLPPRDTRQPSVAALSPVFSNSKCGQLHCGRPLLDAVSRHDRCLLEHWVALAHVCGSAPAPGSGAPELGGPISIRFGSSVFELVSTLLPVDTLSDRHYVAITTTPRRPPATGPTPRPDSAPPPVPVLGRPLPSLAPSVLASETSGNPPLTPQEAEADPDGDLVSAAADSRAIAQLLDGLEGHSAGSPLFVHRDEHNQYSMEPLNSAARKFPVATLLEQQRLDQTPLGPPETWDLLTTKLVEHLLRLPMSGALWIGKDLTLVYNQSMADMMPDHPASFGRYGVAARKHLRSVLGPLMDVVTTGTAVSQVDELLLANYSQKENREIYGTQSWIPIKGVDGEVIAIFNGMIEVTKTVLSTRRMTMLLHLAERTGCVRSVDEFYQNANSALATDPRDVPFALMFHVETMNAASGSATPNATPEGLGSKLATPRPQQRERPCALLRYAGGVGVPEGHPSAPCWQRIQLQDGTDIMMAEAFSKRATSVAWGPGACGDAAPLPGSGSSSGDSSRHGSNPSSHSNASGSTGSGRSVGDGSPWAFVAALCSRQPVVMDDCSAAVEGFPLRVWDRLPSAAVVVPLLDGEGVPKAIAVVGISALLKYDNDYESFIHSLRLILSSGLVAAERSEADTRRMASLTSLDRTKSLLFSHVIHELTSPLSLISGPLNDVLASLDDASPAHDTLTVVRRNVNHLTRLVSMVAEVTCLETGRSTATFRQTNLGVLTRDIAALFRLMVTNRGLAFVVVCDTAVRGDVYVDRDKWEKILFKLIENAVKNTSKGRIRVVLRYTLDSVVVTVEDTGVGIPAADLAWFNASTADLPIRADTTLGIAFSLTKKLVELHHGTLVLESRTETEAKDCHGTVCRITLPLGKDHLPPDCIAQEPLKLAPPPPPALHTPLAAWVEDLDAWDSRRQRKHDSPALPRRLSQLDVAFTKEDVIMVVDDMPDLRSYMCSIFEPYCSVVEARDGQDALDKWFETPPSLVIADMYMSRMGGSALLQALRTGSPHQKQVPFVMLIPAGMHRAVGKEFSPDDYLYKPFNARELLVRVHTQLQLGKKRIGMEKAFNDRTAELHVLTDLSPVGIYRINEDGYVTYANAMWYKISGYPAGPITNWGDYVHDDDKERVSHVWETFVRSDDSLIEAEFRWTNETWVSVKIVRLDNLTDGMTGFIGSAVDITDGHMREELQRQRVLDAEQRRAEAEDAKHQQELLIDIASHEIRNPISSLMQCASMVKSNLSTLFEQMKEAQETRVPFIPTKQQLLTMSEDLNALDSIYECGLTQERISNDVLSLGRIQLNMLQMFDIQVHIVKEAQKIMSVFQSEARMKRIQLQLEIGQGIEVLGLTSLMLDPVRLGQIITNLISNAIRFTADSIERKVTLSVEVRPTPPGNDSCAPPPWDEQAPLPDVPPQGKVYLFVSVRDTGPGLTAMEQTLLFQRFQQASAKTHTQYGGSGLGLFVSRKIAETMGGRIEVRSEYGHGCEFRLFVQSSLPPPQQHSRSGSNTPRSPITGINALPGQPYPSRITLPQMTPSGRQRKSRVLVVEDNLINRTVLMRQLKHVGLDVETASNGLEGLEKIRAAMALTPGRAPAAEEDKQPPAQPKPFDCVLMDLEMPIMDGYTATRRVREDELAGKLAPSTIIALTGNARQAAIESAMIDFSDVVVKPYRLDDLLAKISLRHERGRQSSPAAADATDEAEERCPWDTSCPAT